MKNIQIFLKNLKHIFEKSQIFLKIYENIVDKSEIVFENVQQIFEKPQKWWNFSWKIIKLEEACELVDKLGRKLLLMKIALNKFGVKLAICTRFKLDPNWYELGLLWALTHFIKFVV